MPMPHRTFAQVAKRRSSGRKGAERVRELRGAPRGAARLPQRPVRRHPQVAQRGDRADARPREGRPPRLDRRPPRGRGADRARRPAERGQVVAAAGALRRSRSRPATTRSRRRGPVAAMTRIGGVLVQLVEIPGLIEGAPEDRGGGRALLGVLRNADAIVYCHAATAPPDELAVVRREVAARGHRAAGAARRDEGRRGGGRRVDRLAAALGARRRARSRCSTTRASTRFREAVWRLTGLVRVYLRHGGERRRRAGRAPPGRDGRGRRGRDPPRARGDASRAARIWGPSARFDGPAGRPRPRRRGRRRRRDPALELQRVEARLGEHALRSQAGSAHSSSWRSRARRCATMSR